MRIQRQFSEVQRLTNLWNTKPKEHVDQLIRDPMFEKIDLGYTQTSGFIQSNRSKAKQQVENIKNRTREQLNAGQITKGQARKRILKANLGAEARDRRMLTIQGRRNSWTDSGLESIAKVKGFKINPSAGLKKVAEKAREVVSSPKLKPALIRI